MNRVKFLALASALVMLAFSTSYASESTNEHFSRCIVCHQASGDGIPGIFPAIKPALKLSLSSEGAREYIVLVMSKGLSGSIIVDGLSYAGVMPSQTYNMSTEQQANLLNYIISSLLDKTTTNEWKPYDSDEVSAINEKYAEQNLNDVLQIRKELTINTAK